MGANCCTSRSGAPVEVADGRRIFTGLDVILLPEGVLGLKVNPETGEAEPPMSPIPQPVVDLMVRLEMKEPFAHFLQLLQISKYDAKAATDGPEARREAALIAITPELRRHNFDVYVSTLNEEAIDKRALTTVWFTFVDRSVNPNYVPIGALQARPGKVGILGRLTGHGSALEVTPVEAVEQEEQNDCPSYAVESGPSFAGKWRNYSYEGDMDQFLKVAGIGLVTRNAAAALNYNMGKAVQEIKQEGNEIWINGQAGLSGTPVTQHLRINEGMQDVKTLQGDDIRANPYWTEGGILELATTMADGSPSLTRRFLRGGEMVMEQTLGSPGITVARFFVKEENGDTKA